MIDRMLKALFALILGSMALLYLAHNIANIGAAHDFFVYSTSHADQAAYSVTLLPVPPEPAIVAAMILVFALELAAGVMLMWGAVAMLAARSGNVARFGRAKNLARIGIGCAVLNWWGLFQVIAVAGYQLWQMPLGAGPNTGSWIYGAMNMMFLIYLSQKEEGSFHG